MNERSRVGLPQNDFKSTEFLLMEVGELPEPELYVNPGNESWFNPDLRNSEMAVRAVIREATLKRDGFNKSWWYPPSRIKGGSEYFFGGSGHLLVGRNFRNLVTYRGKLGNSPDGQQVRSLLLESSKFGLNWHYVSYWNLGELEKLKSETKAGGYLELIKPGVLLFSDEMQRLTSGKLIDTVFQTGLSSGYIHSQLDVYKVFGDQLYRVWAVYSD